jgi:putative hydrolase of the HAD superfamily
MIKALLFDADGVVVNPAFQFAKLLAEQYGITREMTSGFFRGVFNECMVGKADLRQVLAPYLPEWGWQGTLDEFMQAWWEADNVVDMRIVNYIGELRQHGMLCCLATNQEVTRAAYMQTHMGFGQVFDRLFFSCELGCQKPDPAYFYAIQQKLELEPRELLLWDDYQKNVDVARECGWQAELYTDFEAFAERIKTWISL